MPWKNCPYCQNPVLVMDRRETCPSCGKETLGVPEPDFVFVGVTGTDALPPVCVSCGTATECTEIVSASEARKDGWWNLIAAFAFVLVSRRLAAQALNEHEEEQPITVNLGMPRCSTCAAAGPLAPARAAAGSDRMTFLAHRKFRAEFAKLRAGKRQS